MKSWHYIVVFALALLCYINTIGHGFVLDDRAIITENKFTQEGFAGITGHFTHSYWYGHTGRNEGNYRPLSGAFFSIQHALFGNSAAAGHLMNILLYGLLCSALLYWMNALALLSPVALLIAVLIFTTHPIHTEVVANIKSCDELFCLLFFTLSAVQYWLWLEKPKWLLLASSALFLLLSFLSKETSVALFPIFMVMALRKGTGWAQALKKCMVPAAVVACYIILYMSVTDILGATAYHISDNSLAREAPAMQLLATKFLVLGKYLKLLFVPDPLVYDYSYNTIPLVSFLNPWVIVSVILLLAMVLWFLLLLRKASRPDQNTVIMALAFIALPLLLLSNLFFPIGATLAERFLFIPSLGFSLLLVYFFSRIATALKLAPVKMTVGAGLVLVLIFTGMTVKRNPAWASDESLFLTDLPKRPDSARAHHNAANIYNQKGDRVTDPALKASYHRQAITLLEKAISIHPDQRMYKQLGGLYGATGQWKEMITVNEAFVKHDTTDALVWLQLGVAYAITQKPEKAVYAFERAHELDPSDITTTNNLGKTYAVLERKEDAARMFNEVLARDPGNAIARENLDDLLKKEEETPLQQ